MAASSPGIGATLLRLLAVLAAAYLAVCLALFFGQRRLLYYPTVVAPAALLEAVRQQTRLQPLLQTDGSLEGWILPPRSGQPAARQWLMLHGNAGHAAGRAHILEWLQAQPGNTDARVAVLEYPGFGGRAGSFDQASASQAALQLVERLRRESPAPLYLFGESLGTGVAAAMAAARPRDIAGLLLLTPYDELAEVAQHHYRWLPVRWLLRDRFAPARDLAAFSGPVAVVVAEADRIVPAVRGQALYDSLQAPRRLWLLPGSDHNPPFDAATPWFAEAVDWLLR